MYNGLLRPSPFDSGQSVIPDLARSWTIEENGMRYEFKLREGVKFHDGAALTADYLLPPGSGLFSAFRNDRAKEEPTYQRK